MAPGIMPYYDGEKGAPKGAVTYCPPGKCAHRDCAAVHKLRAAKCQKCGKPVEPGRLYYTNPHGEVEHTVCP